MEITKVLRVPVRNLIGKVNIKKEIKDEKT